jgi:long-chain acyl-CoA synthetase
LELTLLLAACGVARAAGVVGTWVSPHAKVDGVNLVLNGAGVRSRFNVEIYVIGLYLAERESRADAALEGDGANSIALTFMREVSAQSLVDALDEGVRDNTGELEFAQLKRHADQLAAIMLPLKTARKGDTVALDYLPHAGAKVVVNGRSVGAAIPSQDVYRALLKI